MFEGAAGSFAVVRPGLIGGDQRSPHLRYQRHLPNQCAVERIDSHGAQSLGIFQQLPAEVAVAPQCVRGEQKTDSVVFGLGRIANYGIAQRGGDARTHFSRGLASKRQCDNFLRILNDCQQAQKTLRQQLGFSRPGWRLNNKRVARIERLMTRAGVGDGLTHNRHSATTNLHREHDTRHRAHRICRYWENHAGSQSQYRRQILRPAQLFQTASAD